MLDWLTAEDTLLKLATGGVAAVVSIAGLWLFFGSLNRKSAKFRSLHFGFKIFLAACFGVCVGYGGFKSDSSTNTTGVSLFSMRPAATFTTVSPTAFAIRNWNIVGAWEDSFWCEFTNDFVFPCGTNHLNGVEVVSKGLLWEGPFTPVVVASLGLPVELAPGVSGFNCEYIAASETNEAKYVFTWRDGYVNRDPGNRIDGRIELRRGGDILVATNGVERLIPRVLPFGHNGYGQDDEWVAANFTNSVEILETGYPQWVDAQVGEGLTNGLYKLTVTVPGRPLEMTELSVGDYSVAVTNAGEYVFLLEKGVKYPVHLSAAIDGLEYEWDDGGGETSATYNLPRNISNYEVEVTSYCDLDNPVFFEQPTEGCDGSILYYPIVTISPSHEIDPPEPLCLHAFLADNISPPYADIRWLAGDQMIGTGEMLFLHNLSLYSHIKVEIRYRDSLIEGWVDINCCVKETFIDLSGGGVIITEDTYTNAPNEIVSASSTSVNMSIAYQLTEGGEFVLDCDAASGLALRTQSGGSVTLPLEWSAYYNEDSDSSYIVTASDINAVGTRTFTLTFTPDAGGEPIVRQIEVDVVKIRVEAEADWPSNKVRHVFGPGEKFNVICNPESYGSMICQASLQKGSFLLSAEFESFVYTSEIRVIHPSQVPKFGFVRDFADQDWLQFHDTVIGENEPGVGFVANRYLLPDYVSFAGLLIKEGECPVSDREGCFTNEIVYPNNIYMHYSHHTEIMSVLEDGNRIDGVDNIAVRIDPDPESYGAYNLHIPMYWGVGVSSCCTNYFISVTQRITVDSDGTVTVSKGGITRERNFLQ